MNRNSNLSPLPWYETIDEQGFRKSYAYGKVWPLIAHKDYLLPFQIVLPYVASPEYPEDFVFTIHQVGTDKSFDLSAAIREAGFTIVPFSESGFSVLSFPAAYKLNWRLLGRDFDESFDESFGGEGHTSIGRYYLSMVYTLNGVETEIYSEVLTLVDCLGGYLRLEWFSFDDIYYEGGALAYSGVDYMNYLNICAEVAMPDYTFEEEGEERDGFFFATKQTSEKTYRFSFLATEEICDAVRIVGLSDVVSVIDPLGRRYICDKFSMTPEWQPQGYLAAVNCEFQTDTVVIRRAQAYTEAEASKHFVTGDVSVNGDGELVASYKATEFDILVFPDTDITTSYNWTTATRAGANRWHISVSENTGSATRTESLTLSSTFEHIILKQEAHT